jgi:hypothetical protein
MVEEPVDSVDEEEGEEEIAEEAVDVEEPI